MLASASRRRLGSPRRDAEDSLRDAGAPRTKTIHVPLNGRSFAYYSPEKKGWVAEAGEFGILVGASSRDSRLTGSYALVGMTLVR